MDALWLIPTFPLLGFLVLFLSQGKLPKVVVAIVGAGSIGFAAVVDTCGRGCASASSFLRSGCISMV